MLRAATIRTDAEHLIVEESPLLSLFIGEYVDADTDCLDP